jgi:UDP-glucose 6-dehydrogenase
VLTYPHDVSDKIFVIGSTVNPGTSQIVEEMLADKGIHVVYSPTFVAQGTVVHDIQNPHTLSIGTENLEIAQKCREVFGAIVNKDTPIYVMKPITAEILKLVGNCKTIMTISFFNMVGQILLNQDLAQDIDVACEYLNFVKIKSKFKFGFGYGGPCYPRDNRAFVQYARSIGMDYPMGELLDTFNQNHVTWLTKYFIEQAVHMLFSIVSEKSI